MTRYVKTQITQLSSNESAALQQINKNFEDIQNAIQDTVSRSGQSPTQMTADLDMNGKRLINVPAPLTDNDLVRRKDVVEDIATVQSLVNTAATAAGQAIAAAEGVQEAIADAHVGIVADDLMLGDNSKIRIAANNIDEISACVNDITDIKAVGENISNVNAVADNETNINAVNSNKTNIDTVAGNDTDISTVAGIASDVSTVADASSAVSTVATNVSDVNTCASNIAAIQGASANAESAAASAEAAAQSAAASNPPPLLSHQWFDHLLNDIRYLRADTFSWQDGGVYKAAYDHLVADATNGTSQTETISGHTITYTLAEDGHKIVQVANASAVEGLYNDVGVAWYYILDLVNHRFKLPRENPARELLGQSAPVIGDGKTIGLQNSSKNFGLYNYGSDSKAMPGLAESAYGTSKGTTITPQGVVTPYQGLGLSQDSTKSGMIAKLSETTGVYKGKQYLYFYVGNYTQSATEQTAGLNSELFNGKVDLNAANLSAQGKSLISSIGMPSDRYEVLTLGASGATYTAPANGYFAFFSSAVSNSSFYMSDGYFRSTVIGATGYANGNVFPVKKGDEVVLLYSSSGTLRFYYAKGEENV